MIEKTLTIQRGANADYQAADAILMLMMGVLTGRKQGVRGKDQRETGRFIFES
jgi:hypothetical protein